jgi:hypothetical protein
MPEHDRHHEDLLEAGLTKTSIIHVRDKKPGDVYIGRPSLWGNPFKIGPDGSRLEVIEKYRVWLLLPEQHQLRKEMRRLLRGKRLACFCAPHACHGDIISWVIE